MHVIELESVGWSEEVLLGYYMIDEYLGNLNKNFIEQSAMPHGSKCWAIKSVQEDRMWQKQEC